MTLEELNKEVLRTARRYRGNSNQVVSYEDVAQSVWEHILKKGYLADILNDEPSDRAKKLANWARDKMSEVVDADRYWAESGYYYSPSTVRYGLEKGFGCSSIQTHYAKAFKMLEHAYPSHAMAVNKKYVHKESLTVKERKHLQRGVDRIAEYMNDLYVSETRSYEGTGSRDVISNSAGRMRSSGTWNKNEYAEDGA